MRMRLVGMDKKFFIVQHKVTNKEIESFAGKPNDLNQIVGQNIYNKIVQTLSQTTKIRQFKEDDGVLFNYAMWIYGDKDFWTLIKEICEMPEEDRQKLLLDANEMLGIFTDMENKKE